MIADVLSSTPAARKYIADKAARLHPAWNTRSCSYEPALDMFVAGGHHSPLAAAGPHTECFLSIMEAVKQKYPKDVGMRQFDIRAAHDWQEVLSIAGTAANTYQSRAKGLKRMLTHAGRQLGEASPAVEAVVSVLPQGEYTSIVCGGLVLVFKAFGRMHQVRKKAMEALGDAPLLLEQIESFLRIYPHDVHVSEKAVEMYIALLVMIGEIVKWFDHGIVDRVKVFIQQDMYGKRLEDKHTMLQRCMRNLRDQVDTCDKQSTVEIAAAIFELAKNQNLLQDLISQKGEEILRSNAQSSQQSTANFAQLSQQSTAGFAQLSQQSTAGFTAMGDILSKIEQCALNGVNTLLQQLSNEQRRLQWQERANEQLQHEKAALQIELRSSLTREQGLQSALTLIAPISQDEALHLLAVDRSEAVLAVDHYIRLARVINADSQLIEAIMATPQFGLWMTSSDSQMLIVSPDAQPAPTSAGSFVTASLAQVLSRLDYATTLTYFCRPQLQAGDLDPAASFMASLISQLLRIRNFDLTAWNSAQNRQDHEDSLRFRKREYLFSLFKHLMTSIPYGTVFLLIDDFFHFEHMASQEALCALVSKLSELVQLCSEARRVVFKVLAVTPDRRGSIVHHAPRRDMLWLNHLDGGNSEGVGSRQLMARMERATRPQREVDERE